MSIEQVVGPWEPWFPREQPADLREFDELVEEAEFEAEVCGDVGFADRVFTYRDPEPDRPDLPPPGCEAPRVQWRLGSPEIGSSRAVW